MCVNSSPNVYFCTNIVSRYMYSILFTTHVAHLCHHPFTAQDVAIFSRHIICVTYLFSTHLCHHLFSVHVSYFFSTHVSLSFINTRVIIFPHNTISSEHMCKDFNTSASPTQHIYVMTYLRCDITWSILVVAPALPCNMQ